MISIPASITRCLGLALVIACSKPAPAPSPRQSASPVVEPTREGTEVDIGSLVQSSAVASFDILIPADGDIAAALESARARAKQDGLLLVESLPVTSSKPTIVILRRSVADDDWLDHIPGYVRSKIDPAELPEVKRSAGVVRMEAHAPASVAWDLLRTVTTEARDLADAQRGWIYDPYRAELHDPTTIASIPESALDVRVFTRMMAVVSTKGELGSVRSVGLWRLGLPELYLPDVASEDLVHARELVRATAQTVLQNGGVTRRGVIEVDLTKLPPDWPRTAGTGRFTWSARWMRGPIKKNAMQIVLSAPGARDKDPSALTAALREYAGDEQNRH